MSSDSIVSQQFREISLLLKTKLGAEGNGLIEMTRNVKDRIPRTLASAIISIGRVRNKVIHEGVQIRNQTRFLRDCDDVIADLKSIEHWDGQSSHQSSESESTTEILDCVKKILTDPKRSLWCDCEICHGTGRDDMPVNSTAVLMRYCQHCIDGKHQIF